MIKLKEWWTKFVGWFTKAKTIEEQFLDMIAEEIETTPEFIQEEVVGAIDKVSTKVKSSRKPKT